MLDSDTYFYEIDRLFWGFSAEEHEILRACHLEWSGAAISARLADRSTVEAAITGLYALVGRPPPQFVWCGSPPAAVLAAAGLGHSRQSIRSLLEESFRNSLRGGLGYTSWWDVPDHTPNPVWDLPVRSDCPRWDWPDIDDPRWEWTDDSLWDWLDFDDPRWDWLSPFAWAPERAAPRWKWYFPDPDPDEYEYSEWEEDEWDESEQAFGEFLAERLGDVLPGSVDDVVLNTLPGSVVSSDASGAGVQLSPAEIVRDEVFQSQSTADMLALADFAQRLLVFADTSLMYSPRDGEHLGLWSTVQRFAADPRMCVAVHALGLWATLVRSAGWWFPYADQVICAERPLVVRQEPAGTEPEFGLVHHRLHCEDGPAVQYPDGFAVYSWHGVRVPQWVITNPDVDRALAEPNTEIRRAALERIGWSDVLAHLGSEPIATAPDPGNAPHELALYSVPDAVLPGSVNLLVMVNGSPDRNGRPRRYAEPVPAAITDPLEAAAWQYGVPVDVYTALARRT
ncbi:MAG: hypothetical protein FWF02_13930 [Micrococcales bacterium]|nr:hypothetical protein [Micrococcales bacterium]MCL2668777.1 hypothetical protein [Micrococcales bacterium]